MKKEVKNKFHLFCIDRGWQKLLYRPIFLRLADITLVAEFCHTLGLGEEFLSLVGIGFLNAEVADLAQEEVAELIPLRLFRVERERILAFVGLPRPAIYPYRPWPSNRG